MDFPFPLILSFLSLSERLVLSLKVININSELHSVTRRMQSCISEGERLNKVALKWMWGSRWERGRGQRTEGRRRDARQWGNPESGWEKWGRDGALEREFGCLMDGQDAGGLKTFKLRTQRNQLMYRKPEFLHKSAHSQLWWLPLSLSLSLGKSHENMSQSYFTPK